MFLLIRLPSVTTAALSARLISWAIATARLALLPVIRVVTSL